MPRSLPTEHDFCAAVCPSTPLGSVTVEPDFLGTFGVGDGLDVADVPAFDEAEPSTTDPFASAVFGLLSFSVLSLATAFMRIAADTVLVTARTFVLQVSGEKKASILARALKGREDLVGCPAQWLRKASGRVVIVADGAAATQL